MRLGSCRIDLHFLFIPCRRRVKAYFSPKNGRGLSEIFLFSFNSLKSFVSECKGAARNQRSATRLRRVAPSSRSVAIEGIIGALTIRARGILFLVDMRAVQLSYEAFKVSLRKLPAYVLVTGRGGAGRLRETPGARPFRRPQMRRAQKSARLSGRRCRFHRVLGLGGVAFPVHFTAVVSAPSTEPCGRSRAGRPLTPCADCKVLGRFRPLSGSRVSPSPLAEPRAHQTPVAEEAAHDLHSVEAMLIDLGLGPGQMHGPCPHILAAMSCSSLPTASA